MGNCSQCNVSESKNNRDDIISSAQNEKIRKLNVDKFSKQFLESLNNIRTNIKKYGQILDKISTSINKDVTELTIANVSLTDEDKKLVKHLLQYLSSHEDKVNIVKEIAVFLNQSENSMPIEWSQPAYDIINSNTQNTSLSSEITQEIKIEINKALHNNLAETVFTMKQYYEPYNLIWHLLFEDKEKISTLLKEEYYVGCCITIKNEFSIYLILFNYNKRKAIIDGVNPVTGAKEPLSLEEKFFENLEYKDKIIEGNYIYTGDNILNVVFKLWNGETKEENIVI